MRSHFSVGAPLICCAVFVVNLVDADAQTRPRAFVEAGVLVDEDGPEGGRLSVTSGGVVGGGVLLPSPFTLRVETEVPRWHTTITGTEFRKEYAFRAISSSFLVAGRVPPIGRVQLEPLAGFSVSTQSWRWKDVGSQSMFEKRLTRHWPALCLGIDAPIPVMRRLAVVPQFRVYVTTQSAHYLMLWRRLHVAVRWQF
jgi:hypothetical protein